MRRLSLIAWLTVVLTTTACAQPACDLSPAEFAARLDAPGVVVLDVRTDEEYAAGHLPGAVQLDYYADDFRARVAALDTTRIYLVYCAVGGRSGQAVQLLEEAGAAQVCNLSGGVRAWRAEGRAVEK